MSLFRKCINYIALLYFMTGYNTVFAGYITNYSTNISANEFSQAKSLKSIDRLIVFGDSLSDQGNLFKRFLSSFPMSPPYFEGRFSNGPVWVDFFKKKFDIPSEAIFNYSFGGARTVQALLPIPGLELQVDKYIETNGNQADPNGLYIIWIGSNDIVFDKQSGKTPDISAMKDVISAQIDKLIQVGAKNFLVMTLPNLGFSPEAFEIDKKSQNLDYSQKLQKYSIDFNTQVKDSLKTVAAQNTDVTILSFETYSFLENMIQNAKDHGILYTKERCNPNWYATPLKKTCENSHEYIFWDAVHPTTRSHELLADGVLNEMHSVGFNFAKAWELSENDKNIAKLHEKAISQLMAENLSQAIKDAIFDAFK